MNKIKELMENGTFFDEYQYLMQEIEGSGKTVFQFVHKKTGDYVKLTWSKYHE